jgi:GNAT superfamily N-acetyltransferase
MCIAVVFNLSASNSGLTKFYKRSVNTRPGSTGWSFLAVPRLTWVNDWRCGIPGGHLSTLPQYRRRGFGLAITAIMLQEIRKRGYRETWIWSSEVARSLYQQFDFVDADFGLREHKWHKLEES